MDKARLAPLEPPYEPGVARTLERMMPPGMEPLKLFRTVAHNTHILDKMRSTGAYLLNFGSLDPLEREIVILRTCALCGSEYEWGVHAVVFGRPLGLNDDQVRATVTGATEPWSGRQRLLVRLADELHGVGNVSDDLWAGLDAGWTPQQIVELVALCGQYHVVSFLANALGVELEDSADRFPSYRGVRR